MSWIDRTTRFCPTPLLIWLALILTACTTTPTPRNGDLETRPPIKSERPEVQAQFDAAEALLREGRFDEAVEAFRLLQSEHAGDNTADLAELFIARALLGDLDEGFVYSSPTVEREVFALLQPLSTSSRVDERIRFAAQVYLAIAHALQDDLPAALGTFSTYPGASLSPVVLKEDRLWAWPLVAEGLLEDGRVAESVIAWGRLHDFLHAEYSPADEYDYLDSLEDADLEEETVEEAQWRMFVERLKDLAVARAFEVEERLSPSEVQRFLANDKPLVRAVGGWAFIRDAVEERLDEAAIEALVVVFNETALDFLTIQAHARAAELSVLLASVSGPERIAVGALLPLSGPNRAVGRRALAGMLVAQRSFYVAGEPAMTLIIEDSQGDVVAAYERLVAEGVLAVVGPLETAQARSLVDSARQHQVPLLTLAADRVLVNGAAGAEAENETPPVFRNFVDALAEAQAAAKLSFEKLGDRRAAVVYPDMGYGRAMAQAFADEFRRLGGQVVAEVAYDRQSSDFVNTARAVARSRPDAIFLPDTAGKVAEITAFLAQENIWGHAPERRPSERAQRTFVHYLGTSLWQEPIVLHQAASYVEGALVPAWYSPVFQDSQTRQFTGSFEAIYGRRADHFEAFAFDTVSQLRSLLLDRSVPNAEGVTQALRHGEITRGATGEYRFGADGEPRRTLRFLTIKSGQWQVYEHTVQTPIRSQRRGADRDSLETPEAGPGTSEPLVQ